MNSCSNAGAFNATAATAVLEVELRGACVFYLEGEAVLR